MNFLRLCGMFLARLIRLRRSGEPERKVPCPRRIIKRRDGLAVSTARPHLDPGSPWETGHYESLNSKWRGEPLNGERFYSLEEARVVIGSLRRHNEIGACSSLGYRPPAPAELITTRPSPQLR